MTESVSRGRLKSVAGTLPFRLEGLDLKLTLSRDCRELQTLFQNLDSPRDVSELLEVDHQAFNFWMYRTPMSKRYTTFYISKGTGKRRRIDSPTTNVKILQQKLNQVLQCVYTPKPSVHGFVLGKNVRSNANAHVGKRWVFNVDLEDFFPSINFGRVRGMFMGIPYHLPQRVATVLAHICCFGGSLPQGAPTSPIISNMICAKMDSQLQQLAKESRSTYSRYADDITFSTTTRTFPAAIGMVDGLGQLRPGNRLKQTIESNGFEINSGKTRLQGRNRRQVVTGVTINEFPNLPRKYTNQIRAMLHAWKKHGLDSAQAEWERKYNVKHRAPWLPTPKFEQILKGKIEYLGMIKGQDSSTYLRFLDQLGELNPNLTSGRGTARRLLLRNFSHLVDGPVTPQKRGVMFEELMNRLFDLEEILVKESFRRNDGGEQIDGAFELDGWYYLVECKWLSQMNGQQDVDGLLMKVERSGDQTMGVFISVNGWSSNVVSLMKQNKQKRTFLVNGEDVQMVLRGEVTLVELLRAKREALNLLSEPYVSFSSVSTAAKG